MLLLTEEIGELAKAVRKSATSMAIDYEKIQNYDTVDVSVSLAWCRCKPRSLLILSERA
jgi:hypothetical protein